MCNKYEKHFKINLLLLAIEYTKLDLQLIRDTLCLQFLDINDMISSIFAVYKEEIKVRTSIDICEMRNVTLYFNLDEYILCTFKKNTGVNNTWKYIVYLNFMIAEELITMERIQSCMKQKFILENVVVVPQISDVYNYIKTMSFGSFINKNSLSLIRQDLKLKLDALIVKTTSCKRSLNWDRDEISRLLYGLTIYKNSDLFNLLIDNIAFGFTYTRTIKNIKDCLKNLAKNKKECNYVVDKITLLKFTITAHIEHIKKFGNNILPGFETVYEKLLGSELEDLDKRV